MLYTSHLRTLLLSLIFVSSLYLHAEIQVVPQTINNQPYNTTNNPTLTASPVIKVKNDSHYTNNNMAIIRAIGVKISDIYVLVSQAVRDTVTKKNYELLRDLIKDLLWQNRYKIAGGAALGSYSATSLLLVVDYHQMNSNMFWAYWKHKSTFEDLCAIPQKELAKELLLAIGEHHYNKDNPTDLAYPLIAFIKDIDWEIDTIKRYITTTKILKSLYLMPLFPTNEKKIARAAKMLERALFIKHIFLSWLADYNLTSTEKLNG